VFILVGIGYDLTPVYNKFRLQSCFISCKKISVQNLYTILNSIKSKYFCFKKSFILFCKKWYAKSDKAHFGKVNAYVRLL